MAVLTISREIGVGGPYISQKTAHLLGYHFVDKKVIEKAFRQYGFIPLEKTYESEPAFWDRFDNIRTLTLQNLNHVIMAMASHGNVVILGRGSFAILQGFADVVNVRLKAPLQTRIKRFMEDENITDPNEAEFLLLDKDRIRSAFVESTYDVRWDDIRMFDLIIDTDKILPDLGAELMAEIVKSVDKSTHNEKKTTKSIKVERFMAAAINGALEEP